MSTDGIKRDSENAIREASAWVKAREGDFESEHFTAGKAWLEALESLEGRIMAENVYDGSRELVRRLQTDIMELMDRKSFEAFDALSSQRMWEIAETLITTPAA